MPIKKEPLEVKCFLCKGNVFIKFVPPLKDYSKKNNWYYWTNDEKRKDKKICSKCLKRIYQNCKLKFFKYVTDEKRRQQLRKYISSGLI